MNDPYFSLICASRNRTEELIRFLDSVQSQSESSFEVLIIDQNPDDRLLSVLDLFKTKFTIKHIKSDPGLSQSRNVGIVHARGKILAFPDDDCWYSPNLLNQVRSLCTMLRGYAGFTGRCYDSDTNHDCARFSQRRGLVSKYNIWTHASSVTMFIQADVIRRYHVLFNEELGLGAPFPSGEETDFLLQILGQGENIWYDPNLVIGHPYKKYEENSQHIENAYNYGLGFGRVLRLHDYPWWFFALVIGRSKWGLFSSLAKFQFHLVRYHWNTMRGRAAGYLTQLQP